MNDQLTGYLAGVGSTLLLWLCVAIARWDIRQTRSQWEEAEDLARTEYWRLRAVAAEREALALRIERRRHWMKEGRHGAT
jgi:hypothetical protein